MNLEDGTFKMARAITLKEVLNKTLSKSDQEAFEAIRRKVQGCLRDKMLEAINLKYD
jgi:hypothetical protein